MEQCCDFRKILALLGKKYIITLLEILEHENPTFNQIHECTQKIMNPTLLSTRLQDLELLKIINKKSILNKSGKLQITYSITSEGHQIYKFIKQLRTHLKDMNYDIPDACRLPNSKCICDIKHSTINLKNNQEVYRRK
jgi:DNA-binding HxlR family transcriptional regulator